MASPGLLSSLSLSHGAAECSLLAWAPFFQKVSVPERLRAWLLRLPACLRRVCLPLLPPHVHHQAPVDFGVFRLVHLRYVSLSSASSFSFFSFSDPASVANSPFFFSFFPSSLPHLPLGSAVRKQENLGCLPNFSLLLCHFVDYSDFLTGIQKCEQETLERTEDTRGGSKVTQSKEKTKRTNIICVCTFVCVLSVWTKRRDFNVDDLICIHNKQQ